MWQNSIQVSLLKLIFKHSHTLKLSKILIIVLIIGNIWKSDVSYFFDEYIEAIEFADSFGKSLDETDNE